MVLFDAEGGVDRSVRFEDISVLRFVNDTVADVVNDAAEVDDDSDDFVGVVDLSVVSSVELVVLFDVVVSVLVVVVVDVVESDLVLTEDARSLVSVIFVDIDSETVGL
jgi:hypothetical protein